jgi:hypothetical protein
MLPPREKGDSSAKGGRLDDLGGKTGTPLPLPEPRVARLRASGSDASEFTTTLG